MSRRKLLLANNPLLGGPSLKDRGRGTKSTESSTTDPEVPSVYREIELVAIQPDPTQPRTDFNQDALLELSDSIKTHGVLSPITVRPGSKKGQFILVAGERRFRASQLAGRRTIPAIIRDIDNTEYDILAVQLVENLQREDLSPWEKATALAQLRDNYGLSIREIAGKVGLSKSNVQRTLELLDLPEDLKEALQNGASESKVLLLAQITDRDIRASYLQDIQLLSRNALNQEVKRIKESRSQRGESSVPLSVRREDQRIAEELRRSIGTKVSLTRMGSDSEKGKLIIEFYSQDDLESLFEKLIVSSD